MQKILHFQFMTLLIFSSLILTTVSYAKTSDEYLEEIYKLIEQKQYDEALSLVKKGAEEYPGDLGLTVAYTEIQHLKGNYEIAIANYINIMKLVTSDGKNIPEMAHYHHNLADAYIELGQKHYFSKDLCLRIIYHMEKVLELMPEVSRDSNYIEFLRKSIGHYDVANMGVRLMETGGDGEEFQLPDDYINADEKIHYKDKAMQKIKEYDGAVKESAFKTTASDKTVEDIIRLVNDRTSAIKALHFKRINNVDKTPIEEFIYKSPNKIKVIAPPAISIIVDKDYSVLDPHTNKILRQDKLEPAKVSLFKGLGFYNLGESSEDYNLTIEKITGCPDFLSEVCKDATLDLYLITGRLKSEDKGPYPPTPKVEYFIDVQSGLCVAKREYWLGVLGSGKKEELAREDIITRIEQPAAGVYLPSSGITRGLISELADLNQDWVGEVVAINQEINDETFSVPK